MKCFDNETGCLTAEAIDALIMGALTDEQRLECAEHLAFCDECLDRYNERLGGIPLEDTDGFSAAGTLRLCRLHTAQTAMTRYAAAAAAFVLAAGMWSFGVFDGLLDTTRALSGVEINPVSAEIDEQTVLQKLDELFSSVLNKRAEDNAQNDKE